MYAHGYTEEVRPAFNHDANPWSYRIGERRYFFSTNGALAVLRPGIRKVVLREPTPFIHPACLMEVTTAPNAGKSADL